MSISPDLNDREHGKFQDEAGKPTVVTKSNDLALQVATDSGDSNVTYVGKAAMGSATSAASWQIKKIDETSGTVITWADGNASFDNIFDNRESLSYS